MTSEEAVNILKNAAFLSTETSYSDIEEAINVVCNMLERESISEKKLEVRGKSMTREQILNEAEKCVCGRREIDYGTPENNFDKISRLWSDYLCIPIKPHDVAMMMCLLKIARSVGGFNVDNYVDIAGYAACAGELAENKMEGQNNG